MQILTAFLVLQSSGWGRERRLVYFLIMFSLSYSIGVAPITQVTHVQIKNSNIQGRRPLNLIKVSSITIRIFS